MKLTLNSKEILKNVQLVGGLIKPSSPLPILTTVLFNIENDKLTLVADNSEVRSSIEIPVEFFGNYFTCIPYAHLTTVLKALPDGPVEFNFTDKDVTLVSTNGGVYKMPVNNATEFPKKKAVDADDKVTFNSMDLVEAIKKALAYTGTDPMDWNSTVLLWFGEESTRLVGGTINSIYEETLLVKGKPYKLQISRSTADYITKAIHSDEPIEVSYTSNKVFFKLEGREISAVRPTIAYANYENVFNKLENDKTYKVDKDSLLPALKRVSSITDDKGSIISMDFSTDALVLSYENTALDFNGKEVVQVDYEGGDHKTGFPADQLINILNFTDGDEDVVMEMSGEAKPCLITQGNKRCLIAAAKPKE